jgi:hypothetical protein
LNILDLYKDTPQPTGHLDIIFEPIFAKKYVHFDVLYFVDSTLISIDRGSSGWGGNSSYSLDRDSAIRYILSDDKKKFRKAGYYSFNDTGVNKQHFHKKYFLSGFLTPQPFYKTRSVKMTCCKSEIKITDKEVCLFVNKVAVANPPFLCPKTGIIWKYRANQDDIVFSDKFWLFKQIPKTKVIATEFRGLEIKRKVQIDTLKEEDGAYDKEIFFSPTKTSFLSGSKLIRKRLGWPWEEVTDHRDFLLKQPKTPKFAVIKSAARYLKKRLRVSPLRQAERNFFQMLGALAHINNETLNRKKVYAA